jgi:RimJ/RimL family protein N-acetyltransferase
VTSAVGGEQIRTERLVLSPVRVEDAEDLYAILREPALGEFTGDVPPIDVAETRERITSWLQGPDSDDERWRNWIARSPEGTPVAHIAATVRGASAWLAWIVALDAQRRGYATEAALAVMEQLASDGVAVFLASIPAGHGASEGVARNLGLALTDQIADGERVWRRQA